MVVSTTKEQLNATDTQVGGDHYKKQGLQPFELTHANFGYEGLRAAVYTKVNKYLTRDKGTHEQDLEKAIHCLQVQLEFYKKDKL
tara:strand:+ start:11268 stop:11522 length:255 start_codon:yes stop_codon:yes gene_type:complete